MVSLIMNICIDLSFSYKAASVSVKIVHNLLFIEASEFHGIKGVDCTKRTFKTCKKIDYTDPEEVKAFYRNGKIRIVTENPEKRRGETEIKVSIIRAKNTMPKFPTVEMASIPYSEFENSLRLMGMIN